MCPCTEDKGGIAFDRIPFVQKWDPRLETIIGRLAFVDHASLTIESFSSLDIG